MVLHAYAQEAKTPLNYYSRKYVLVTSVNIYLLCIAAETGNELKLPFITGYCTFISTPVGQG